MRTLFVSGLPIDTRQRELYLLFRGCSGYETSLLKNTQKNGKPTTPVGFVTFASRQDADEARRKLQGVRFDPEHSQTIRLELARSNTKVTKPKQPSPPVISPAGLPTLLPSGGALAAAAAFPGGLASTASGDPTAYNSTTNVAAAYAAAAQQMAAMQAIQQEQLNATLENGQTTTFLPQQQHLIGLSLFPFASQQGQTAALQQFFQVPSAVSCAQQQALAAAMAHLQQQQNVAAAVIAAQQQVVANGFLPPLPPSHHQNGSQRSINNNNNTANQPCSTLFVANLGVNINEEEIRQLFKAYPGFSRLRMHNKGGAPVAFVEYQDVKQATIVLNLLQGFLFSSSEKGNGIRIEFARTKMGDVSSHNLNSQQQQQSMIENKS